jgi:hypothetical protein
MPVRLRHFLGRLDAWLDPGLELFTGCVVLVLSAGFWINPAHPIWHDVAGTAGAILGPFLVYRAWKRKPSEVRCDTCAERASIVEVDDEGGHFYVIACPRCGPHAPPSVP